MTLETANRLYQLRKKHNLSQEELAEKLGVSRQAVSKWERSEASPDTDNLIALAKIYDLSLDELIYGGKEEKKEEKKEETKENTSAEGDESVYIDIDDGEDKVKIGPEGILVEEKNGNTVKININGKIMEKVIKKIEDNIDEHDDEDDDDDDDDELYETVYFTEGDIKGTDKKLHLKIKKTNKFWLEVPYPIICALAYLIFGFYDICGGFALSWVIFITIPVYYTLVEAIYKRSFAYFSYPVFCVVVYLVCGLYFHNWHPSWLIFVTVPVYYPIADALDKVIRRKRS
jgi:transcriptional regulator with XRE-family HTH domain